MKIRYIRETVVKAAIKEGWIDCDVTCRPIACVVIDGDKIGVSALHKNDKKFVKKVAREQAIKNLGNGVIPNKRFTNAVFQKTTLKKEVEFYSKRHK